MVRCLKQQMEANRNLVPNFEQADGNKHFSVFTKYFFPTYFTFVYFHDCECRNCRNSQSVIAQFQSWNKIKYNFFLNVYFLQYYIPNLGSTNKTVNPVQILIDW